jgi:DNA-binding transcriptional LysR family regulator
MNYTLHQLQVFLKVTETQSVTKAAEELYLTQPAVSIQLKNFQDQFDIPLTEVVGRKLFVTDFGKEIAQAAEVILNEVHLIETKTQTFKGKLSGKLKISVVSTAKYVIPFFLSEFLKENDAIELVLDITNKSSVVNSLEENEVDFSLVSILPEHLNVNKVELMQNKLFLVSNTDFKIKQKMYDKKIFHELPLIYREKGSGTRTTMEKFIKSHKLPVVKKLELKTNEGVKQAVIAGLGCSIMPLIGIKNELQQGELQIIPVQGFPIKSYWNLIWLKEKKLSPVANAFLTYIKKNKSHIIEDKFNWFETF